MNEMDRVEMDETELSDIVPGPPMKLFIRNTGGIVKEPCVLVGHVSIEADQRPYLDAHGINTTWAEYREGRWERCLMSESVADMLVELYAEGSFPHAFEVGPSLGEVAWIKARYDGAEARPALPLQDYLTPADADTLDAVSKLDVQNVRPLTRRRPRIEQ